MAGRSERRRRVSKVQENRKRSSKPVCVSSSPLKPEQVSGVSDELGCWSCSKFRMWWISCSQLLQTSSEAPQETFQHLKSNQQLRHSASDETQRGYDPRGKVDPSNQTGVFLLVWRENGGINTSSYSGIEPAIFCIRATLHHMVHHKLHKSDSSVVHF